MRELKVQVTGVEPMTRGLTPVLQFKLHLEAVPATDPVQAVLLSAQVQLECPQRDYTAEEQEKLVELFGPPAQWGQTLRNRLWTHANTTVSAFTGSTVGMLPVPCTYDLNVGSAKYLYALEGGEVSLLFLFSGSLFYASSAGRLQVAPISWNTEASFRLPVQVWRDLMEQLYPNRPWLALRRDVFERLYAYRRRQGLATWEETLERLLPDPSQAPGSNEPAHVGEEVAR